MKIAVVEDEPAQTERLKGFIERFAREKEIACQTVTFFNAVDFLSDYTADYDAVFFDIQLPMLDGMAAAEKLRKIDVNVQIVFLTNMAQFAIRGYKVRALDFLVKPIEYFDLSLELEKVLRLMRNSAADFLWVNVQGTMRRVAFDDIRFIEVMNHNVCIHMKEETLTFRGTLKEVEGKLSRKLFSRCDNCYIVNMYYVAAIEGDLIRLETGDMLHISRARKKSFMEDLTNYINRG